MRNIVPAWVRRSAADGSTTSSSEFGRDSGLARRLRHLQAVPAGFRRFPRIAVRRSGRMLRCEKGTCQHAQEINQQRCRSYCVIRKLVYRCQRFERARSLGPSVVELQNGALVAYFDSQQELESRPSYHSRLRSPAVISIRSFAEDDFILACKFDAHRQPR